ncbi:2-amino-4-hydroxy-6-hydroxymethyldihydropteridine diphosphokinase [Candidatus Pelagibacter bacterium]|jgi:2-amino-4-hydroxy-6-hydroxymethyldihydropteridine diphosphokinase|nr:2-amino-4-hydroxy-6-hydroxymethyldihydropteridine diphosphokinase [Candidatus Pelagibacter bacterium]|tara:strand:+ start:27 stop:542 length:516 start_codon:yes stop_codon:yes gene_type:complete
MIHLNIGSNLNSIFGNKFENISTAINFLIELKFKVKKTSNFYETPSYPNKNLPKFLNIGILGTFDKNYNELLKIINLIEKKMGRIKSKKNDPRVCDIDIIDFNGNIINFKNLAIPHKKSHLRNFVLYPINQIDPNWSHPILKKNVKFLINKLNLKSRIEITRLNKNVNIKI